MISTHSSFLAGATSVLALVASLIFLRFFRRTRDPLFFFFSLSFLLQAIGRVIFVTQAHAVDAGTTQREEGQTWLYVLRLIAYGLIIFAIVQKNRARRRPGADPMSHV